MCTHASAWQVHVAFEKGTGRKLAVKVQHRGLAETAQACDLCIDVHRLVPMHTRQGDLDAVAWLTDVVATLLPSVDFRWLAEEAHRVHVHFR